MKKVITKLIIAFETVVILISIIFVITALSDLISGEDTEGIVWALLVFFIATGTGAAYMMKQTLSKSRNKHKEKKEREILNLITKKGGRVTPVEIASETQYTLEESQALLEKLCKQGIGQVQVTDSGSLVYTFEGVLSESEKNTAASPLAR